MLYYLLQYINDVFDPPGFGVVEYITFRASAAAITSLLITIFVGPRLIAYLKRKYIEPIKEEAPRNIARRKSFLRWEGR